MKHVFSTSTILCNLGIGRYIVRELKRVGILYVCVCVYRFISIEAFKLRFGMTCLSLNSSNSVVYWYTHEPSIIVIGNYNRTWYKSIGKWFTSSKDSSNMCRYRNRVGAQLQNRTDRREKGNKKNLSRSFLSFFLLLLTLSVCQATANEARVCKNIVERLYVTRR